MTALTRILGLGAFLAVFIYSNGTLADSVKDVTCEQFLAMDEGARNNIVYWVHGVQVASSKKTVAAEEIDLGYDVFGRPVAEVVTACEEDKKVSLWDKIKAHFSEARPREGGGRCSVSAAIPWVEADRAEPPAPLRKG